MSIQLTQRAIEACGKVAADLSIDPSWLEQRYVQLKSECRVPFPVDASLIDLLYQTALQKPRDSLSIFFGVKDWEERSITTKDEKPFESTFKLEGKEFSESDENREGAVQKAMQSGLSYLIQEHPVHFNRFRSGFIPAGGSEDPQNRNLRHYTSIDNLTHLFGENFYISISQAHFAPIDPKPTGSTGPSSTETDTIEVQMHLQNPESRSKEGWSAVVATGTAENPNFTRDEIAEAFFTTVKQVKKGQRNPECYPEILFDRQGNLMIDRAAPNLNSDRDKAAEAFLKISARGEAAQSYLKTLDLPVKRYFVDLSKMAISSVILAPVAGIIAEYLDGDWLGYSHSATYLAPIVKPFQRQTPKEACIIS